ncbi:uncharacterized protein LOC128547869 isoform X2 [Mercenaria mercenaria]|uniref:uncharacterized protein LOC128547869 isoform X2 n=1 Tax=Mercenaria mercenaria TaxID=6596 RepID=UPI00234F5033|nr:uncharacterized protein LOC128547869 isoform X2 [Mercenaria mercenaria]
MNKFYVLLFGGLLSAICESKTVTVSSSNCGGTYTLDDDESLYLNYYGASISECRYTVNLRDITDEICSSAEKFDVDDCDIKLEYHEGSYVSFIADETYGCSKSQWSDYCTSFSTLVIVFKNSGGSSSDSIKLKVSAKDNAIVSAVVTSVYVIVGIIVGVVVLVIIVTVVVICVCCRRRRSQAGTVYRAQQPAVVTTTTGYPMQSQAGYQPVQPIYQPQQAPPMGYQQPAPQTGYPPPAGYQPAQQAGYPPPAQQGYAGYQTGADPNPDVKASAPPMQPPPYPGN